MDFGTVAGLVIGFGMVLFGILSGGGIGAYVDPASLLIVVGGTLGSVLISDKMQRVILGLKVAGNAFRLPAGDAVKTIETILKLSNIARREGVLALENEPVEDAFLQKGVRMAVDGLPQDEIRETLTAELISMKERHTRGHKLFRFAGECAPALGMIGTLIGLVRMLETMEDPSTIGPAMAVALLTTLYGAMMAFLMFNPIAEKLEHYTREETANMVVVIEGIDSIVKGYNAMIIKEKLEARLPPEERAKSEEEAA